MLTFDKPKNQKKKPPVAVRVFAGGREVCNLLCKEGRDIYMGRIETMRLRQKKICCLFGHVDGCPGALNKNEASFEHADGRGHGGGHRDDRIEIFDPQTGQMKPINGAAHPWCNSRKGSQRINYNDVP